MLCDHELESFPHHLDPFSSAEGLVDLPLRQVVFRPGIGPDLDGLLERSQLGLLHLRQLLGKELLKVPQVRPGPLVARVCKHRFKD